MKKEHLFLLPSTLVRPQSPQSHYLLGWLGQPPGRHVTGSQLVLIPDLLGMAAIFQSFLDSPLALLPFPLVLCARQWSSVASALHVGLFPTLLPPPLGTTVSLWIWCFPTAHLLKCTGAFLMPRRQHGLWRSVWWELSFPRCVISYYKGRRHARDIISSKVLMKQLFSVYLHLLLSHSPRTCSQARGT